MKYRPSLRRLSYSWNTNCNDFKDSFNSPDSALLDAPINNVGSCAFSISPHFNCTRFVTQIHLMSNPPPGSFNQRIPTQFEPIGVLARNAHSSQCCSCSCRSLAFGPLELRASRVRVTLQHCLSRSLHSLCKTLAMLGLPPALHWNLIDLCSRHRLPLHWADCSENHPLASSHCISIIIWIRTWYLAAHRRLDSPHKPFILLYLS